MNRLGKSLITDTELLSLDRIVAEIDAVEATSVCELAAVLLAPERLSAAGIGPERGAVPERARAHHARPRARGVRISSTGASERARSARCSGPALEAAGHELVDSRRAAPRRWSTSRGPTRSPRTSVRRSRRACPSVVGTTGWDTAEVDGRAERGVPVFYAPNFAIGAVLMMRFAAEAAPHSRGAEIVELHHDGEGRRAVGHREARPRSAMGGDVPIHSVRLPGLVAHQEVILGGAGQTLTIRHDTISREAYMPGVLLALSKLADAAAGLTVGLDALL